MQNPCNTVFEAPPNRVLQLSEVLAPGRPRVAGLVAAKPVCVGFVAGRFDGFAAIGFAIACLSTPARAVSPILGCLWPM